ncbi:MAG: hypothetical protein LBT03_00160 [Holosporales bacterium]|jgi:hypothetical protein|nr:hypothetical protein [Holosporales bacterium]
MKKSLLILETALSLLFVSCSSTTRFGEKFDYAFSRVLVNEGGYVNDPDDRGGETKFGISRAKYKDLDIKNLTIDQAKSIYYRDYWLAIKANEISDYDLAMKVFDISVNFGILRCKEIARRALRSTYGQPSLLLREENWDVAIFLINRVQNKVAFLTALRSESAGSYRAIVEKNVTQEKFLNGWLNRAYK